MRRSRWVRGFAAAVIVVPPAVMATGLAASAATPTCRGEAATIVGTADRDDLIGTSGRDVIVGLGKRDHIDGRGGNDLICGGPRADRLQGGSGPDRIYGGSRSDRVIGGPGEDFVDGGAGGAFIDYTNTKLRRVVVDLAANAGTIGESTDRFAPGSVLGVYGTPKGDRLVAGAEPAELMGGAGADVLIGGPAADDIFGNGGNDTLRGGRGWNYLDDGPGRDEVRTLGPAQFANGAGSDTVVGGVYADEVFTASGQDRADVLRMRAGNDEVEAGPGADRIDGGTGRDLARGGRGDDTCVDVERVWSCAATAESALATANPSVARVVMASDDLRAPLPRCRSWTSFGWGDEDDHYWTKRPTTRRNNSQWDCKLHRGYRNEGVKILEVALNRCHGANLSVGPLYTRRTERVVTRVRQRHDLSGHGYGPALRERMKWPEYHNGDFDGCAR